MKCSACPACVWREHPSGMCTHCRAEKAEAEVQRLRAAIDEAISLLTPVDVSTIKWPGFHALLKLSRETGPTEARKGET